ncbi:MAG: glycosyltransferase family 2 protein, partial [Chloroflexota bacterium]
AYRGANINLTIDVTAEDLTQVADADLPIYTILVPLYQEFEVLPQLVRSIDSMDYPKSKLDVKLLLEENDRQTIDAAVAMRPPSYFEFVIVPDSMPRTKPKACNYGLVSARGTYTVIFDAEDRPDQDQLKKAVVAFRKAPGDVACLQAKLNYFNRNQNLLTRWFTTEYSTWFDLILPGLDNTNAPIPLGGTSNHFYTEKLRELGGWDPYNVTEDADLGIRMFKHGYRTAIIDSTTYEEANSEWRNWIRQRSRWVKGYMQTWLVHMRHPIQLLLSLGINAFASFHLTVGGTPLVFLLNPIYWTITSLWFLQKWDVIPPLFPGPVYVLSAINLIVGNFIFVYLNLAGVDQTTFLKQY